MNLVINAQKVKMQKLIEKLNEASDAYYNGIEIMSDHEYDFLYDQLEDLEKSSGIILEDSPTKNVGASVKVSKLKKVAHEFPALSLDKTKDISKVLSTFSVKGEPWEEVVVMWKLDGSTVQLTYDQGHLILAATRGDGHIGQDITHNAPYIRGIPLEVEDKSKFTVRGEAVISYEDFGKINDGLPDDQKFKNPRNLAAASITMLDPNDMKDRHIQFYAFELVDHPQLHDRSKDIGISFFHRLSFCSYQGFKVVPNTLDSVHSDGELWQLKEDLEHSHPSQCDYYLPVDGLVIAYDDVKYTDDLRGTEHHPNILKGYAFKWEDELAETVLCAIEWSPSRTGLLNPVAIFDPVELEGTTVSRASLHNVSIIREQKFHMGDRIQVYKANKIIPQVFANLNYDKAEEYLVSDMLFEFGCVCPSCGSEGSLHISKDHVETMYCENEACPAKLIYKFEHFCDRTSMNIEGLSEATIEKFVNLGYLKQFSDIYTLDYYEDQIKSLEGFGETSWNNLWDAIQKSKQTDLVRFITAVGIPNIGISQAKSISKYFNSDVKAFLDSKYLDFSCIDGIGSIASQKILIWLHDGKIQEEIKSLLPFLSFESIKTSSGSKLTDKIFVITGSLNQYSNRKQLESVIESNGGKVAASVSSKTSYLINNDVNSTSSKNKKAKELGIEIITEEQFMEMLI